MSAQMNFDSLAAKTVEVDTGIGDRDTETALVAEARKGSAAAIEELVDRYESRLFRLARRFAISYEDAEEAVQNSFLKAFQNLAAFRGDSRFYTWLAHIAVNEALMKMRRRRSREVSIDDADAAKAYNIPRALEDWGPNPEERYSQQELRTILETTINELDPGYRVVFQLRDVEDFSTDETARALNLSVPTVKTRLLRARLQLRNSLAVYFQPAKQAASDRSKALSRRPRTADGRRPKVNRRAAPLSFHGIDEYAVTTKAGLRTLVRGNRSPQQIPRPQ